MLAFMMSKSRMWQRAVLSDSLPSFLLPFVVLCRKAFHLTLDFISSILAFPGIEMSICSKTVVVAVVCLFIISSSHGTLASVVAVVVVATTDAVEENVV